MSTLHRQLTAVLTFVVAETPAGAAWAQVANGFDLSDALIPVHEIRGGGPPRDGIPSLDDPAHVPATDADTWLDDQDRVMGVFLGGEAVAYPIRILNWHEIVNDLVGGRAVVITYCPLCGTGVVFEAMLAGQRTAFGVSGLLYNSDVLLYDRRTMSLFSQMMFKAVAGPLRGMRLQTLPATTTTWAAWKGRHPSTLALSQSQRNGRDYSTDPYRSYRLSGTTMFPVKGDDTSRSSKSWAWLVVDGEDSRVIAEQTLERLSDGTPVEYNVGDNLVLTHDPEARELRARRDDAGVLTVVPGYWFALTAFHPGAREIGTVDLTRAGTTPDNDPFYDADAAGPE